MRLVTRPSGQAGSSETRRDVFRCLQCHEKHDRSPETAWIDGRQSCGTLLRGQRQDEQPRAVKEESIAKLRLGQHFD